MDGYDLNHDSFDELIFKFNIDEPEHKFVSQFTEEEPQEDHSDEESFDVKSHKSIPQEVTTKLPNLLANSLVSRIRRADRHLKKPLSFENDRKKSILSVGGKTTLKVHGNQMSKNGAVKNNDTGVGYNSSVSTSVNNLKYPSLSPRQIKEKSPMPTRIDAEKYKRFLKVEKILQNTRAIRKKRLMDKIKGINTELAPMDIDAEDEASKNHHGYGYNISQELLRKFKENEEVNPKQPNTPTIPGPYIYPREEDFFSDKTRVLSAGFRWELKEKFKKDEARQLRSPIVPKSRYINNYDNMERKSTLTIPGKLCRNLYPVTEALHREGTSVTKKQFKSLNKGEWKVMKVIQRSLNKYETPLEMIYSLDSAMKPFSSGQMSEKSTCKS